MADEPEVTDEPTHNYSAPLPLPLDWRPGYGRDKEVADRPVHKQNPIQPVEDLGIGALTPYPSKEDK